MNKRSHFLGSVLFLAVAGGYSCSPSAAPLSEPGPEPKPPTPLSRQELQQPNACASCHEDHFREWSGSMHAYASEDPVFVAMNRRGQRETGGALGNFCVQCHAPLAVREGATVDGLNLDQLPSSMKGVNCYFCHSVDAVEGSHNNPLRLSTDSLMRGGIADPLLVGTHGSAYSALHARDKAVSAALCGTCHDVTNAVGVPIERTYKEWQDSVFSTSKGATCNQCHMGESLEPKPAAKVDGAKPRKLHAHDSPGVDVALTPFPQLAEQRRGVQELLNTSVQSAVCVAQAGDQFSLRVILDNVGGGHKFPSGAAHDRRVWVEVVAYDGDRVLYESGTRYGDGKLGPEEDPDLWALRDCLYDKDGNYTSMFWKAASHESNLLPAQATFDPKDPRYYQTHFLRSFPLQGGLRGKPSKVTLRVRMRPLGADLVDELIASGDLDPIYRDRIPTFDLGTEPITVWTPETATGTYYEDRLPVSCASASNLNVQAQKTPFEPAPRCRR